MSTSINDDVQPQESVKAQEKQDAKPEEITELNTVDEKDEEEVPFEELYESAKRNFALKQWAEAVDGFGQSLESLRDKYSEDDPILAPLHHRYGHALLEHAIATSGALGGGGGGKDAPLPSRSGAGGGGASTVAAARAEDSKAAAAAAASSSKAGSSNAAAAAKPQDPRFTFGGDAEDSDDEEEGQPGGDEEDGDDLGDAFAVLELARVQYEKLVENSSSLTTIEGEMWDTLKIKSQLAEVLNDLADVGLESENFQQSSSDYKLALELLEPLLLPFSRRLADANLRLGLALEFHPDPSMQASAERYVTAACIVMRKRLDALQRRQAELQRQREGNENGLSVKEKEDAKEKQVEKAHDEKVAELEKEGILAPKPNNGKGKQEEEPIAVVLEKDDIATMDWQILTKEMADIKEMIQELELKLEEFANAAPGTGTIDGVGSSSGGNLGNGSIPADTKAALQQAINEAFLGVSTNGLAGSSSAFGAASSKATDPNVQVNDLSSMVRKKKKAPEVSNSTASGVNGDDVNGKRKASDNVVDQDDSSKRTRVEEEA